MPGEAAGKQTLVQAAEAGVRGSGGALPHIGAIQRAFGRHDVSGVGAHVGGAAGDAAGQIGAQAYATGDQVAFAAPPDLWLAAHESAHVVQQRRGVELDDGVGASGDAHEQHANAVADAVVRGESAEPLLDRASGGGSVQRRAVQRFGSLDHQSFGDQGSNHQSYVRATMALSHGDLTMLRGDYFSEADLTRFWSINSPMPGKIPGTQDEIIAAIHVATKGNDPRFAKGGMWHDLAIADVVTETVKQRYYALAEKNTDHFLHPGLPGFGRPGGADPGSSAATYRDAHERAIAAAYLAGATNGAQGSIDDAFIIEAMGEHFLTDSFAAGHATTRRGAILHEWDKRYPEFGQQFVTKVVNDLTDKLSDEATKLSDLIPKSTLHDAVHDEITDKLKGKPLPTLGILIGSIAHDYDNDNGMAFTNDLGYKWFGYGDGNLDKAPPAGTKVTHTSRQVVVEAVKAGCEDIRNAWQLGYTHKTKPMGAEETRIAIRKSPSGPAVGDPIKYAPEQFLPRLDPDAHQAEQNFHAGSLEELWKLPIRPGKPTWGQLIVDDMSPTGSSGKELVEMMNKLDEEKNPFDLGGVKGFLVNLVAPIHFFHGYIYPRRAFKEAVLDRLQSPKDALNFLIELVNNR